MLNVLLWLPLAAGLLCFVLPRRMVRTVPVLGALAALVLAVVLVLDFEPGAAGLGALGLLRRRRSRADAVAA